MKLSTESLLIWEFKETDWRAVHRYAKEIEVMRYITYRANSEEDTKEFVQRALNSAKKSPRTHYSCAVVLRDTPEVLIGACDIGIEDQTNREWSIGYCFHSDYWGKGFATEVSNALLSFGFTELGAHRISAVCNSANGGSARVLEKCRLRREACFREKIWYEGHWYDELQFAILDDEWQALQESKSGSVRRNDG